MLCSFADKSTLWKTYLTIQSLQDSAMSPQIIFTLVSLISAGLALLITVPLSVIIISHLQRKPHVVFLLMANTYITMFAYCFLVLLVNINVLQADLYGSINLSTSDSTACRFQGFLLYVTFGWCYMSFVIQAFYRFTRVLYPKRKIFQVYPFAVDAPWN